MDEDTDSVAHTRKRRAKMQEESDQQKKEQVAAEAERKEKQAERDRKTREEDSKVLTQQASLIQDGETREHLLERVRQMREEVPPGPPPPPPMSDYQKEQLRIEQEVGAAGVKRAQEEIDRNREARRKAEAEVLKREGTMTPVHHPNPGMDEQFPAQKATLGKTK